MDTVPCCYECNMLAGAEVFVSLKKKREYIHRKLKERYRELLSMPYWTDEEIDALGPLLCEYIKGSQSKADLIRLRLRWTGGVVSR
jgi:hypothetical protein